MKVKDLRKILEGMPDDAPVLLPMPDHSYREASAQRATALKNKWGGWTEDYGEELTPEAEYGRRLIVLLMT